MRKVVVVVAFVLALVAPAVPADAGYYTWERSWCQADVWWFGTDYGVWYWLDGYSEAHGAHLIEWGTFWDRWRDQGHECGTLKAPLTNKVCVGANYAYQDFVGGRISRNWC